MINKTILDIPYMTTPEFMNFSPAKRTILELLKVNGELRLEQIAVSLGKTKMAILKQIKPLESTKYIQRSLRSRIDENGNKLPGRPVAVFQLGSKSHQMLTRANSELSCSFLDFIKDNLGDEGIKSAFEKRKNEVYDQYRVFVNSDDEHEKVLQLKEIRDRDGYMVELDVLQNRYEFREYNCPIVGVAERYGIACDVERDLFSSLLGMRVKTTHSIVNGNDICKFIFTSADK